MYGVLLVTGANFSPCLSCCRDFKQTPIFCESVFVCVLQDGEVLRGAEGGEADPQAQTPRKSSSSRSSRKSFRLDYRLEVKPYLPCHTSCRLKPPPST